MQTAMTLVKGDGDAFHIFHLCTSDDDRADEGLALGPHTVQIQATLPGTDVMLMSNPTTVSLSCDADHRRGDAGPGGCNATGSRSGSLSWLGVAIAALLVRRRRASL